MGTDTYTKKVGTGIKVKQINMPTPEDMKTNAKGTISTIQNPASKSAKNYVALKTRIARLKKGGSVKKKKKFPDLSGDGKVTKKDILMARGVIKKKKTKKKAKKRG